MLNISAIRHAESEGNVDPKLYAEKHDSEIGLTARGIEQAKKISVEEVLLNINNRKFVIYTSPFVRARTTAEIFCGTHDMFRGVKINENPLLIERQWGELRDKVLNNSISDADFQFFKRPIGGESFFDLYQRVLVFCEYLHRKYSDDTRIIIFSHGEWIKMLKMIANGQSCWSFSTMAKNVKIANTQVVRLSI